MQNIWGYILSIVCFLYFLNCPLGITNLLLVLVYWPSIDLTPLDCLGTKYIKQMMKLQSMHLCSSVISLVWLKLGEVSFLTSFTVSQKMFSDNLILLILSPLFLVECLPSLSSGSTYFTLDLCHTSYLVSQPPISLSFHLLLIFSHDSGVFLL